MQNYKDLKVWRKGHELTLKIYKTTRSFPEEELYALISQMRRSSCSIPTNIAEGCGRSGKKDLCRFLEIAIGSANELEYQILLAKDLKYLGIKRFQDLTQDTISIRKMLYSFIKKVRA